MPETAVVQIVGGFVNRTGNDFTLAAGAVPADANDIDSSRPTEAKFYVAVGQEFTVVDSTGKRNQGVVTVVSADQKTITATRNDSAADWDVATTELDIVWLGHNLDHCECPPCIGYRPYAPTYENSMYKDGVCATYCEETIIAEGGWAAYPERTIGGYTVTPDKLLTDKQKELTLRMDTALFWRRRIPKAQADAAGVPQGLKGIMQQIEGRALKISGTIDTLADLNRIGTYLKKTGVTMAYLDATPDQFEKLMNIQTTNVNIQYDPFVNHQNDLMYLGYKGVKLYNGVTILFRQWEGLSGLGSEKLGKAYNFIITPAGKVDVTLNGTKRQMGYVNIVWFGTANDVYKYKRESNENDANCGNIEIKYINKFSVVVLGADRFILGVNP